MEWWAGREELEKRARLMGRGMVVLVVVLRLLLETRGEFDAYMVALSERVGL
jgi:hypothetical protein